MSALLLTGLLVSLVFSFFFSVVESAFQIANKLQFVLEGRLGSLSGRILSFFANHPSWFLGTTLVGTTVSLVFFTVLLCIGTAAGIYELLPSFLDISILVFIIQSILAGTIILVFSFMPSKMVLVLHPNKILSAVAVIFFICFVALSWLTFPLIAFSRFFTVRVLGMKYDEKKPFLGSPDVQQYQSDDATIDVTENIILDKKIFHNALEFKTVKIRDCMIPRTEITAVELNDSIEKLRETFVESGHSKVIIYKQSIDEIIGYCHTSSMFKKPEEIREILTPIIISAETNSANELMIRFIRERKSLAVVIDEFGGTSGIVSMEDIIEEIFGKIDDEHDEEDERIEQQIDPRTYLLSARLEIDYLNKTYDWSLPAGEYETLGGLILAYTEDFPKQGQIIRVHPFTFTVQSTGSNRIDTVIVQVG